MIWTFGWRFFDPNEYRIHVVQEKVLQNSWKFAELSDWTIYGLSEFTLFCWHETVLGYALYVCIRCLVLHYGKSHPPHVKSRNALSWITSSADPAHQSMIQVLSIGTRVVPVQSEVAWHVASRRCAFTFVNFGKLWYMYSVPKHQLTNYLPELVRRSSIFIFVCTKA